MPKMTILQRKPQPEAAAEKGAPTPVRNADIRQIVRPESAPQSVKDPQGGNSGVKRPAKSKKNGGPSASAPPSAGASTEEGATAGGHSNKARKEQKRRAPQQPAAAAPPSAANSNHY